MAHSSRSRVKKFGLTIPICTLILYGPYLPFEIRLYPRAQRCMHIVIVKLLVDGTCWCVETRHRSLLELPLNQRRVYPLATGSKPFIKSRLRSIPVYYIEGPSESKYVPAVPLPSLINSHSSMDGVRRIEAVGDVTSYPLLRNRDYAATSLRMGED